jgi:hypothetical protein
MKTFKVNLTEQQCTSLNMIAQTRGLEIQSDEEAEVLIQSLLDDAIEIETTLEKLF